MNLRFELAGGSVRWTHRASARADVWFDDAPWRRSSGALRVHVGGPLSRGLFSHWFRSNVDARCGFLPAPRVLEVLVSVGESSLNDAWCELLGCEVAPGIRELPGRLAELAGGEELVLVLYCRQENAAAEFLRSCEAVVRSLADDESSGRVWFVIVCTCSGAGFVGMDLRYGAADGLGDLDPADLTGLWRAYVRQRVAWECRGELERVLTVAPRFECIANLVDDEMLEMALGQAAQTLATELPLRVWDALGTAVDQGMPLSAAVLGELRVTGAIDAGGEQGLSGWVARRLTQTEPKRVGSESVRAALVCRPLAIDLLGRCLALEGRIRGVIARQCDGPPEDAVRDHAEFLRRTRSQFFPRSAPVWHQGPWSFAGLGSLVHMQLGGHRLAGITDRLRRVRNHLAHGQYVTWAVLVETAKLEVELRGIE